MYYLDYMNRVQKKYNIPKLYVDRVQRDEVRPIIDTGINRTLIGLYIADNPLMSLHELSFILAYDCFYRIDDVYDFLCKEKDINGLWYFEEPGKSSYAIQWEPGISQVLYDNYLCYIKENNITI